MRPPPGRGAPPPGSPPPAHPPPAATLAGPPSAPGPGPAPGLVYASVWYRLAAFLLDLLVMSTLGAAVGVLLLGRPAGRGDLYALGLSLLLVHAVYLIGLWQTGRTVGMRATGLCVLRAEDGGRLRPVQASLRFLPFGLALVVPILGLVVWVAMAVTAAIDVRGQGLHDRLAGSVVVRRPREL
jgi:uncharacterized RDD family membrane protein YckC